MPVTVNIGEARTRLSELIAKVEAGEEVIIARGHEPVARLTRIPKQGDLETVIADVKAIRARAKPVSIEEIIAWKHEGHRY
jgi:prevent-host-death family protein